MLLDIGKLYRSLSNLTLGGITDQTTRFEVNKWQLNVGFTQLSVAVGGCGFSVASWHMILDRGIISGSQNAVLYILDLIEPSQWGVDISPCLFGHISPSRHDTLFDLG
jgi:hypothetical protein